MGRLLNITSDLKLNKTELTSNPKREVANQMYQKLGFKIRETNVYTIDKE